VNRSVADRAPNPLGVNVTVSGRLAPAAKVNASVGTVKSLAWVPVTAGDATLRSDTVDPDPFDTVTVVITVVSGAMFPKSCDAGITAIAGLMPVHDNATAGSCGALSASVSMVNVAVRTPVADGRH
jgi:hypothetical protein